jgi:hypothetical protein
MNRISDTDKASLRDAAYGLLRDADVGDHDPELERLCRRAIHVIADGSFRRIEEHLDEAERARILASWADWREAAA